MKPKHLISFAFVALPLMASAQIQINETNFPDENFRNYLREQDYGQDGVITDEEIKSVTSIDVYYKNISSLKGIEFFTALTKLHCSVNELTDIDVSKNTALTDLDCSNNWLTAIDVSKNTALEVLNCSHNRLTDIDVSKNTALTFLNCDANELTTIDVSKNTALTFLNCGDNLLTAIDVSKNTALTDLNCEYNQLTAIDVSKNTALTDLDCDGNQLTTIDVSKNTALKYLYCDDNLLTAIDVSKNTALEVLNCGGNQLTDIDVSKNTALKYLYCHGNQLTDIDVSKNTALTSLYCHGNQLTAIDVTKNTALKYLYCNGNQLTDIDVSKNTALTFLSCGYNQLTAIDVSKNTALTYLACHNNQIKGISMDALINSLPENPNKGITFDDNGTGSGDLNDDYADGKTSNDIYILYIYDSSVDDGNICTRSQVAAIKTKGWTPYDYGTYPTKEYAGCDDPTSVTVSVNSDGLSTYCPVFDVDFSSATKIAAYTATVSDNTVYLEKVKAVAAGEGVLLRSLNGGEVTEELPINKAEKHEGNAFVGTLETIVLKEKVDNATNFILGWNSGTLGFYKANDTRLSAWEAYLPVENYNPSKPLRVVFSDVTDINEIIAQPSTEDDAFYTLSGVRVTNPTKGIYIKNGKKVVVK